MNKTRVTTDGAPAPAHTTLQNVLAVVEASEPRAVVPASAASPA